MTKTKINNFYQKLLEDLFHLQGFLLTKKREQGLKRLEIEDDFILIKERLRQLQYQCDSFLSLSNIDKFNKKKAS